MTVIVTATKRTAILNGTDEIDEVVTDYAHVHFEPCMSFTPGAKLQYSGGVGELHPGQGAGNSTILPNVYRLRLGISLF